MNDEENQDAKPAGNPSEPAANHQPDATASSSTATTESPTPDARPESSPVTEKQGAKGATSTSTRPEKKTLREIVKEHARPGRKAAESPTTDSKAGTTAEGAASATPAAGEGQGGKTSEPAANTDPDANVPFHAHPRWQEKLASERQLKERVGKLEPEAALAAELRELTGGDEGFKNMRELAVRFARDPAAAVPMLEQLLTDARARGGLAVTSDDLRKAIDEGEMSEDAARQIEKARAGEKLTKQQLDAERQARAQSESAGATGKMVEALNSWEGNMRQRDPDFGPLTELNDPNHGLSLADQVFDQMAVYASTGQTPKTAQEAVALIQKAYDQVKKRVAKFMPARPELRAGPQSQSSSNTVAPAPKSLREVVRNAARRG